MVKMSSLLVLAIAVAVVLLAQEKPAISEDEGKILALESVWNRAEQAKDINALLKLLAPNLLQFLNSVKNDASPLEQLVTEDLITRPFGENIVVTGVYRGKSTKNGKTTVIRGRFMDMWAKINGSWQCVASLATPITK